MPAPPGSRSGIGGGGLHDRPFGGDRGRGSSGASADQRHRNRLAEIGRIGRLSGLSTAADRFGVSPAGRVGSIMQGMARDYRDIGNTPMENAWNGVAGFLGFNEQRPDLAAAMRRVNETPSGRVTPQGAGWGFDPAGLIGGLGGAAAGVPFGGLVADWVSRQFDRPLEIGLGPSVFGGSSGSRGIGTAAGGRPQVAGGGTGDTGRGNLYLRRMSPMPPLQGLRPATPTQPVGLRYRPQMTGPVSLNANAPGLAPYGATIAPWRYFA